MPSKYMIFIMLSMNPIPINLISIVSRRKRPAFTELAELYHHYVSEHTMKGYVICCGSKLIQPRAMALHMARHLRKCLRVLMIRALKKI